MPASRAWLRPGGEYEISSSVTDADGVGTRPVVSCLGTGIRERSRHQRHGIAQFRWLSGFASLDSKRPETRSGLADNPRYLAEHPEFREFLARHPGVREEIRENPRRFVRAERRW